MSINNIRSSLAMLASVLGAGKTLQDAISGIPAKYSYHGCRYEIVTMIHKPTDLLRFKVEVFLDDKGEERSIQKFPKEEDARRFAEKKIDEAIGFRKEVEAALGAVKKIDVSVVVVLAIQEEYEEFISWPEIEIKGRAQAFFATAVVLEFMFKQFPKVTGILYYLQAAGDPKAQIIKLLEKYEMDLLISIGISGALKDVQVGDVVVSSSSFDYTANTSIKDGKDGKLEYAFTCKGGPLEDLPGISSFMANILLPDFKKPFENEILASKPPGVPDSFHVKYGVTVSGNSVVKSSEWKAIIQAQAGQRGALCVGQEDGGITTVLYQVPWDLRPYLLIVRGISDQADKTKQLQQANGVETAEGLQIRKYAMKNAMATVLAYLQSVANDTNVAPYITGIRG